MSPLFTEVLLSILICDSCWPALVLLFQICVRWGWPWWQSLPVQTFHNIHRLQAPQCSFYFLVPFKVQKLQISGYSGLLWNLRHLGVGSPAHVSHLHVFVNKIGKHTQLKVNIPTHRQCLYTYLHTHKHKHTSWPCTLHLNWELLPPFPLWEALAFRSDFVSNRETAVGNPWTMSLNRRMRVMFIGIKINFKFLRGRNQIQCFPVSWHFLYWWCLGSSGEGRGKKSANQLFLSAVESGVGGGLFQLGFPTIPGLMFSLWWGQ